MASFYKSTIKLFLNYELTFELALSAANRLFKVEKIDRTNGKIFVKSGILFSSLEKTS